MAFGKKLAAGAAIGIVGFGAGVASSTFVRKLYNDLLDHIEDKIDDDLKLFDLEADGSEEFVDQMLSDLDTKGKADRTKPISPNITNIENDRNGTPVSGTATGIPSCYGSPRCGVNCYCAYSFNYASLTGTPPRRNGYTLVLSSRSSNGRN